MGINQADRFNEKGTKVRALCDAERMLVEDNIRLVYHVAWQMLRGGKLLPSLMEDAISEGMCGLINAARQFDPTKGHQFSTLALVAIRRQIRDFVKKELNQNKLSPLSIDEPIGDSSEICFADTLPAQNDTESEAVDWLSEVTCSILCNRGKSLEYEMLMENVNGRTMVEIARDHGVSKQRVHKQIGDAKKLLCEEMNRTDWFG